MRVLVTGGAGFIGSHYVRGLLGTAWGGARPSSVVVLDALTYAGDRANLDPVAGDPRLLFVHGDVCDPDLVADLMREVDAVVHLAAESHVDRSIAGAGEFVRTNVVGTQVLLDAALTAGVDRFVQVSTDEVYGAVARGSWAEDQPPAPSSPYSASKASADLLALAYHRTHGLGVRVTRCSNNYGPYQFPEKVVPLFVTNLLDGGTVPLYGEGANVRDWLHVDDHCRGIHRVLESGRDGEVYHLGGGTELTNKELTGLLLEATGAGWDRVEQVPDRPGHDLRYSLDAGKARTELGWTPQVPFTEGLAETVAWYRTHRDWWEAARERARTARAAGS